MKSREVLVLVAEGELGEWAVSTIGAHCTVLIVTFGRDAAVQAVVVALVDTAAVVAVQSLVAFRVPGRSCVANESI